MTEKSENGGSSKQAVFVLLGVLLTAIATIWGITWGGTSASIKDLNCRQMASEKAVAAMDTRLGNIEQNLTEVRTDVKELLKNQRNK